MNIFIHRDGKQCGPFTQEQIESSLTSGEIAPDTLAWKEGLSEWEPVFKLVEKTAPPPPPPPPPLLPAITPPPVISSPPPGLEFHVHKDGSVYGPFDTSVITAMLLTRQLGPSDSACAVGGTAWLPIAQALGVLSSTALLPSPSPTSSNRIDQLNISDRWKARFHLIEGMGWNEGHFWTNRKRNRQLMSKFTLKQRMAISWNIWGFLFGPFYYMYLGMWGKGLVILVICLILSSIGIGLLIAPAYCSSLAAIDYYKHKMSGR